MGLQSRVIIIGTGWAGQAVAKTYLHVNPSISLTLLSNESTVGGVWSKDRLYPSLIANSPNGLYEFTDLSMVDATHPAYELIPGEQVQEYLRKYAVKFDLISRTKFNSKVTNAARRTDAPGWTLTLHSGETLTCDKLIVSSGLYHNPKWPSIPTDPSFQETVIHSKSLGTQHQAIVSGGAQDIDRRRRLQIRRRGRDALPRPATPRSRSHWLIRPSAQGGADRRRRPEEEARLRGRGADALVRPRSGRACSTRRASATAFCTRGLRGWGPRCLMRGGA